MENLYFIHESDDSRLCPILLQVIEQGTHLLKDLHDYFALLLHSLMIETGFEAMNQDWKLGSSYSFKYKIKNDSNTRPHCSLNIHKIGPVTQIIGKILEILLCFC